MIYQVTKIAQGRKTFQDGLPLTRNLTGGAVKLLCEDGRLKRRPSSKLVVRMDFES